MATKNDIKAGTGSIVSMEADVRGEVTISAGAVLHPRCSVLALGGPIIIGENCIVEENAILLNRQEAPMLIGSSNLFEVGCRIEAPSIGSNNIFEPKSRVPSNIRISDWCSIGAGCVVLPSSDSDDNIETLPSRTVVYGQDCSRRMWSGEGRLQAQALHIKQLEALRENMPRYLKLQKF